MLSGAMAHYGVFNHYRGEEIVMSQFYASIQGNRGMATRCGTKSSGIEGHIRGWNNGVKVYGYHYDKEGDEFQIYVTGGSGKSEGELIGTVTIKDGALKQTSKNSKKSIPEPTKNIIKEKGNNLFSFPKFFATNTTFSNIFFFIFSSTSRTNNYRSPL